MPVLLLSHSIENKTQHPKLRDELLNTEIFYTLKEAVGSRTYNGPRITKDLNDKRTSIICLCKTLPRAPKRVSRTLVVCGIDFEQLARQILETHGARFRRRRPIPVPPIDPLRLESSK